MRSDADPFRTLYDANHQRVRGLLVRSVGPQDAEDLAQLVFAKAAKALPSFRGDAQTSSWLYRIAANVAADWLRGRSAHEAKVTVPLVESTGDEAAANSPVLDARPSPEQELARKDMCDCIRGVIGRLPDGSRTVLVLGELGGFTDDDIARTLGISRGNAKVRLHRARAQLKQALQARCDFDRNEDNELVCEPKPAACRTASPARCSGAKVGR